MLNSSVAYETLAFLQEREDWANQLDGVALASDAFIPFRDNVDRAVKSRVAYIAAPGGAMNDSAIIEACDEHGVVMIHTPNRLFHH